LILSGALLAIGVAPFFLSKSTFRREKIPTQWKRGPRVKRFKLRNSAGFLIYDE
jgi:hypothetical protein